MTTWHHRPIATWLRLASTYRGLATYTAGRYRHQPSHQRVDELLNYLTQHEYCLRQARELRARYGGRP